MLTLHEIAARPQVLTHQLSLPDGAEVVFRPLGHDDVRPLADFLAGLSPGSRRLSTFDGYNVTAAQRLCDAIGHHDKLRLVLEVMSSGRIAGLVEFSLDLPAADLARYRAAGVDLVPTTDCRFGPTLADDVQGNGVGILVFPLVLDVARRLGKTRIILWGGVRSDNDRAIRFYEKVGFRPVGSFAGIDGRMSLDMMLDLPTTPDPTEP